MPEMPREGWVALDDKVVVFVFDHHAQAAAGGASVQEAELGSDQQVLDDFYGIADEEQETQDIATISKLAMVCVCLGSGCGSSLGLSSFSSLGLFSWRRFRIPRR
jgi:hypothetical protein